MDVDKVKHAVLESGQDLVRFQQVVSQQLAGLPTYDTDQVNQVLLQQGAAFFPVQNRKPQPIHDDAGVQCITRCRWRHLHMCRQFAQTAQHTGARQLHMMFQSWCVGVRSRMHNDRYDLGWVFHGSIYDLATSMNLQPRYQHESRLCAHKPSRPDYDSGSKRDLQV